MWNMLAIYKKKPKHSTFLDGADSLIFLCFEVERAVLGVHMSFHSFLTILFKFLSS